MSFSPFFTNQTKKAASMKPIECPTCGKKINQIISQAQKANQ